MGTFYILLLFISAVIAVFIFRYVLVPFVLWVVGLFLGQGRDIVENTPQTAPEIARKALLSRLTDFAPYRVSDYRAALINAVEAGITLTYLEAYLDCNRGYFSRMIKDPDYYPTNRVCKILGIVPRDRIVTARPSRRMVENPTVGDLAAAYRNVIERSRHGD